MVGFVAFIISRAPSRLLFAVHGVRQMMTLGIFVFPKRSGGIYQGVACLYGIDEEQLETIVAVVDETKIYSDCK